MSDTPQRVALVTGASRGIGRAIAEMLGDEGYTLTLSARNPDSLAQTAEEMRGRGVTVEPFACDVAEPEEIAALARHHEETFGRLDVLVSNAGIGYLKPLHELTPEYADQILGTNLRAPMMLYRECLSMLKAAGAEHDNALVVTVSSISGKHGEADCGPYSATKAGLIGFTEAMNEELNDFGIKSVALCPGYVDTDMAAGAKDTEVPAEDFLAPQDLAEAVRFVLRLSPACVVPEIIQRRRYHRG